MRRVRRLCVILLVASCSDGSGPSSTGFQSVALSTGDGRHVCGIVADGGLFCWGPNGDGQLGAGTTDSFDVPVKVDLDQPVRQVVTGNGSSEAHTCALTTGGAVYCWGSNVRGQLGDGTLNGSSMPVPVSLPAGHYMSLTAMVDGTCAIATGGAAYCWGDNISGRFGTGDTSSAVPNPSLVLGGFAWHHLALGDDRACGVREGGQVYCWGWLPEYLGTGVDTNTRVPLPVLGSPPMDSVTLSLFHQCGLTANQVTYCWGANLNIGVVTSDFIIPSPIPLDVPPTLQSVHSIYKPTFGLGNDGKGYWWGPAPYWSGGGPQTPVPLEGDLALRAIGTNDLGVCGIEQSTSLVYCWNQFDIDESGPPTIVPEASD